MHDVLVAGGGPVGSYIAYRLAEMGYDVLVLEQRKRLGGQVCCTGIISQECFSSFAIDSNVVLGQANSARVLSPSGKLIRLWRKQNQVCIIDRAAFDAAMARRAKAAGAEYLLDSRVEDIQTGDGRIVVEADHNGHKLHPEARVAVIATGFGSRLTERAGLGKNGDFVIGAQAEVETRKIDEIEVYLGQGVAPGFFAWLVPISPPRALIGLLTRSNPGFYLRKLLLLLKAQGKIVRDKAKVSYRIIPLRPPDRTYTQRLIVIGGAAGQVKPTTGGGIYFGLLSTEIAADILHRALEKDDLSAKSLAGYEREWKKQLEQELNICYWARRLYEHLNDQQIDRIFDITSKNGIAEALLKADDLSFDWHGTAILRAIRKKAFTKAMAAMKIPFHIGLG